MFRSYRIGSLFGFPIEVNLSFLLMLGVVLLWMGGLAGVMVVLLAFGSVLLHELGHALVARHLGVNIAGIELHFFGGAAKMTGQPRSANDDVAIAAAGPAVSFALGGLGFLLGAATGAWLFHLLGWLNIVIGGFNLVPALPMDGGRILRALLTRKYDFVQASSTAVVIARGFAILLGVYGLATLNLYLPVLAVLLWIMGTSELTMARAMGDGFTYDRNGYRWGHRSFTEPLHPGFGASSYPGSGIHRPMRGPRGFVIRRRNGRMFIDMIDHDDPPTWR